MVCHAGLPPLTFPVSFSICDQNVSFPLGGGAELPSFSVSHQTGGHWRKRSGHVLFRHAGRRAEEEACPPAAHGRVSERPRQPQQLPRQSAAGRAGGISGSRGCWECSANRPYVPSSVPVCVGVCRVHLEENETASSAPSSRKPESGDADEL